MILAAILFAAAAADAGPDCTSDDLPQQDMNYCAGKDFEEADAELNEVWQFAVEVMHERDEGDPGDDSRPGYYQTLLDAQRAWLAYRDKHCIAEGYLFRGGSMEPFMVASCKAHLTRLRTDEVRALADVE